MRDRTRLSFIFAAFLLSSACSDDNKRENDGDDGGPVTGERDSGVPGVDGSLGIDGGGPATNIDGSIVLPDGQVITPPGPDATLPDGAALPGDGAVSADASGDASSLDASGPCNVNDPKYGCGTLSGTTWISFPDFEVDLANKVAWTKPVTVVDDDALKTVCASATNGGFAWELPQMEDVRKIAAGCAKTVPGGSCQVYVDEVLTTNSGDCACDQGLVGPNNGRFCRPEVPECETFWVWTHTYETGAYQHWFYDVKTGTISTEYVGIGIALDAKGRCVHDLADSELPAFTAP